MEPIFIITILLVIELSLESRFSIYNYECNNYLNKFGNVDLPNGIGPSKLAFTGDVSFITGTNDAKVNVRYSDVEFFDDPIFFGFVKEDGKTEDTVCLELKLFKFTSNYSVEVKDLPITSSKNQEKQWRYYSFTIPRNEFKNRLVETANSNQFIYEGLYAIGYYPVGLMEIQYTFYFELSLTIDKRTGAAVDALFTPFNERYSHTFGMIDCKGRDDTYLKWCTDSTCTSFTSPNLHQYDRFFLQQVITREEWSGYYLTGTEVWFTGVGLNKRATPISINNNNTGQVIIELMAEIAWQSVTIKVISTLSTTQTESRRMLVQTKYDPLIGETQEIECIKAKGEEACPTCEQECDANGFAHGECEECFLSQQQIVFIFLALLLVLTI
ncbi:unnamed protein product [Paramecium pentaurelia]|uniref:Uncharacterized protein n=1 Tax=Paramecium pentaurelia TaxID=43138 RepID=A0A8S1XSJ0_9CILI|nr:unnamed protein product [Paramecium pentaurelia]